MLKISLFAEDTAHEAFVGAIIQRLARELSLSVSIQAVSVRGGYGKVTSELEQYIRDLRNRRFASPDLLIVTTDANCKGRAKRIEEVESCLGEYAGIAVLAIPEPHIERWFLLDSAAFKIVLGRGCSAPDHKCERMRYKTLLAEEVRKAGLEPLLGGIEYAEDIVNAMDISRMVSGNNSLSNLLGDLIARLRNLTASN